jgi:ADP-ribosylglycohydrolase
MPKWDFLANLLRDELVQLEQEGYELGNLREQVKKVADDEAQLLELYRQTETLPMRKDFPYVEPSDLDTIRRERPAGPRRLPAALTATQWQDKFYGAWLGRCAGCALGKPLETGQFVEGHGGRPGWKNVHLWFEGADAYPIQNYVPGKSRASDTYNLAVNPGSRDCLQENIRFMVSDDDIRYTVLGLILLEEKGAQFDTWEVGHLWHRRLTYGQVYTAENRAYLNFANLNFRLGWQKPEDWREQIAWVSRYKNPYREWIGAQIRADPWGYAAAGNPELAAEFAWQDASLSHVKNGIYGEMFIAAMISAAFVEPSIERIIEIGLSEIPARSRLAEDIRTAVTITRSSKTELDLVEKLWNAFRHYHPIHTNNNAALVTAALLWADGDFEKAIATAVLGGLDTDCNGATVGSIMGAHLGAAFLPEKWIAPLHDTLYAEIPDFHPIAISECARRMYEVHQKIVNKG